ncbi:MAG: hypothetical protein ACHQPI_04175 [Thermoanaerobaculia bacterium]
MNEPEEKHDQGWVAVKGVPNETEAAILAGFLDSEGIPARVVDRSFHMTPTVEDNDLSPIAVAVPKDRLAEAEALLATRESGFPATRSDDEAVLTDEGPAHVESEGPERKPGSGR